MTKNAPEGFLTQKEVEDMTGFGTTAIWKWTKKGLFPKPFKPGGKFGHKFYRIEDVEAFKRGEYLPQQEKPTHVRN